MTLLINQSVLSSFEKLSANVDADKIVIATSEAQRLDLRPFLGKSFYDDFIANFSNAFGIASAFLTVKSTKAANGNFVNQALINISGTGTGATATVSVYNGYVQNLVVGSPGTGYNSGDMFSIASVPGAVFTVNTLETQLVISGGISQPYRDLFNGKDYVDKAGHDITYDGIVPALSYWTLARFIESMGFEYTNTGAVTKNHDDAQSLSQKDIVMIATRMRSKANAAANDIEQFLYNNMTDYPLWRYNQRNKTSRQPGARITGIDRTENYGYGAYNNGYGYDPNWPFGGIL